jgi:HKD family nuclease
MAICSFVFQGLTVATHEEILNGMLSNAGLESATFSVAFVRRSGVRLLQNSMLPNANKIKVFAGIRNAITSYQGLELLMDIGISVYCVDVGQVRKIFHPKVYVSKGVDKASIMVGSANLTSGGLIKNIESSIALNLDLNEKVDVSLFTEMYQYLQDLEENFPDNVCKLSNKSQLQELLDWGLISDELVQLSVPIGISSNKVKGTKPVPSMKLKTKKEIVDKQPFSETVAALNSLVTGSVTGAKSFENYIEAWRSKPLKASNINLITSPTAAKKNVLSLGQGGMNEPIDFQNYFRNVVFAKLDWQDVKPAGTSEALAPFEIRIGGIFVGVFELRIRFSQSKKTVEQNNVTTRLVWGELLKYVSAKEYLGKIVYLSRHISDPKKFLLEID